MAMAKSPARRLNSAEAEAHVGPQHRQPHLGEQLVLLQRGRHEPLKNSGAGDERARRASRSPPSRRRAQAATAHHSEAGSACAMLPQNVPRVRIGWCAMCRDHLGEQLAERAVRHRLLERRVAHASRRCKSRPSCDLEPVEPGDAVDVDQVPRPRQAERHGGHQALPAGQHAAVVAARARRAARRLPRRSSARDSGTARVSLSAAA